MERRGGVQVVSDEFFQTRDHQFIRSFFFSPSLSNECGYRKRRWDVSANENQGANQMYGDSGCGGVGGGWIQSYNAVGKTAIKTVERFQEHEQDFTPPHKNHSVRHFILVNLYIFVTYMIEKFWLLSCHYCVLISLCSCSLP